jgi:hypothetical protein
MVLLAFNFIAFFGGRRDGFPSGAFLVLDRAGLIHDSAHLFPGSPDKIPGSRSCGNWLAKC